MSHKLWGKNDNTFYSVALLLYTKMQTLVWIENILPHLFDLQSERSKERSNKMVSLIITLFLLIRKLFDVKELSDISRTSAIIILQVRELSKAAKKI